MSTKFRLPTEIPDKEYPEPQVFIDEALRLVKEAADRGIVLRVIGGLAIYLRCSKNREFFDKLKRLGKKVFTDIDLITLSKYSSKVIPFFKEMGYQYDPRLLYYYRSRIIFFGGRVPMVDVFLDKLEMCHTLDLNNRLDIDSITIPLADLLLEKLQIVKINEKDIKDVLLLLKSYDVGDHEDTINVDYIAKLLANDWGFYYTVTSNLNKIKDQYITSANFLSEDEKTIISERINKILTAVEKAPKSTKWHIRAKIGTKKKWYKEVEEIL
ncbi:MAG: hypothetical protein QXT06_04995 [Candidatus Bathyarchaeia archaeon]